MAAAQSEYIADCEAYWSRIGAGETLLEVPTDIIITAAVAVADPHLGRVYQACTDVIDDEDMTIGLYLAFQRRLGAASRCEPWLRIVPDPDPLASWPESTLAQLHDPHLCVTALTRRAEEDRRASEITERLLSKFPDLFRAGESDWAPRRRERDEAHGTDKSRATPRAPGGDAPADITSALPVPWTPSDILWGLRTVAARAYGRRVDAVCLVPVADTLNHGNVTLKYGVSEVADAANASHTTLKRTGDALRGADGDDPESAAENAERDTDPHMDERSPETSKDSLECSPAPVADYPSLKGIFSVWTTRTQTFEAGEEVLNSYGRRNNEHLLMEYGFALENNHWECVNVAVGDAAVMRAALRVDGVPPMSPVHIALMRQLGLSNMTVPLRWNTFCSELLVPFRARCCDRATAEALYTQGASTAVASPLSLTEELRAVNAALQLVGATLGAMPTSLHDDEQILQELRGDQEAAADADGPTARALLDAGMDPARLLMALRYRVTRKRILHQQLGWLQTMQAYLHLQTSRLAVMDAGRTVYPKHAVDDMASAWFAQAAACASSELNARLEALEKASDVNKA